MTRENRGTLIKRLVQNGMGMVELHATWVEPRFNEPGVSAEQARERLRNWRLAPPADYYRHIRKEFDDAGIAIFSYYVNFNDSYSDAEVDATFEGAKILGAKGCVGSHGLALTHKLASFPGKHGMFLGIHNHDNLSDPDAYQHRGDVRKRPRVFAGHQGHVGRASFHRQQMAIAWASWNGITNACPASTWVTAGKTTDAARPSAKETRRLSRFSG